MKAIEILVKEHDSILKMIEITTILLNKEDKTTINIEHVEKVIDFIKNFADKYHHLKEEDILFLEMEKHGMSREFGPIAMMLHEHNEGRNYIRLAVEGIERFKQGDISAFAQIKENLMAYCILLTNHIAKENNILYPMSEQILPANVLSAMSDDFEKSNTNTFENEYYDKYLKLIEEFSNIYLN
ncbi:hemerythrin domain-containing protein [Flavobacterium sp. UBA6031]|uniref:hemerythrin domain-containing protein n=1 Tax=Flavobacterium sp. UBA6031 TaxID=1946551 RepID=UPI0025BF7BB1|nr:hemerythrin domain-containing protein [Flavobacterium sp. UBA6031]